ncbi:MAG: cytochrome c5 family protein [Gammaproteobacteria bacterium]|nr:cytochrome c5 family protein [Gammaproteobacteria bacterium]
MSNDKNQHMLQNFTIIIAMILALICLVILLIKAIGSNGQALSEDQITILINETQPAGQIRYQASAELTSTVASSSVNQAVEEPESNSGQQIYDTVCMSCHSTGLPNVPQLGNAADWEGRIAQGEVLYENAINGYTGSSGMMMPPKGGNLSLSDDEVRAAVDYIIESSQ